MPDISTFLNQTTVPATSATSARAAVPAAGKPALGKDDFLKLLMAQLQNQDPMKPMDDTAMIAQMAQFSALEATQQLNATITQSANVQTVASAGALIGKYVQANLADGSSSMGAVTGVNFTTTAGVVSPTLVIDGKDVDYSTIVKVSSSPITQTPTP
ncbi:MAG TPA: flagellar hook capping FlgD N-terminal domain-containing protein [Chloroflexota bacterium]|nr:flagellar hook capping FlgD N-terminal domain-containing protein [Chloroflexota bacterium]